jgi:hypothetical protein
VGKQLGNLGTFWEHIFNILGTRKKQKKFLPCPKKKKIMDFACCAFSLAA